MIDDTLRAQIKLVESGVFFNDEPKWYLLNGAIFIGSMISSGEAIKILTKNGASIKDTESPGDEYSVRLSVANEVESLDRKEDKITFFLSDVVLIAAGITIKTGLVRLSADRVDAWSNCGGFTSYQIDNLFPPR